MTRNLLLFVLMYSTIFMNSQAVAQDWDEESEDDLAELYGDDNFVSIATGTSQSIERAPAVASVITADTIAASGARDLDELLQVIPGLHVSRTSNSYNPVYVFRGIHSFFNPQALVLINGIPITNIQFGNRGQSWGGMPVDAIARIEVIRGPGSALYGADAFSGVINIHTKNGKQAKPNYKLRYGSFNTVDVSGAQNIQLGSAHIGVIVEYQKTDGHDEIIESDAQTILDSIFGTDASLAPGSVILPRENLDLRLDVISGAWQFRLGAQRRFSSGKGVGVAEALDPVNRYSSDRYNADISWNDDHHDDWNSKVQASMFFTSLEATEDQVVFPPGVNLGAGVYTEGFIGNPELWERHRRLNWTSHYNGFGDHTLTIGGGYAHEDLYKVRETKNFGPDPETGIPLPPDSPLVDVSDTEFIFLPEDDRENVHVYVQDIWPLNNDWELTMGVRHDHYSDFGDTTNPRIALVGAVSHDATLKFLLGRAFRAPSFAETRGINNPVALGNPELKPETMQSIEVSFDYQWRHNVKLHANVFDYRWDDIILFIPDEGGSTSTAQNFGEQRGRGVELEISWQPSFSWEWSFNSAFVDATNSLTDEDVPYIPTQQAYVELSWQAPGSISVISQWHYVGGRQRTNDDIRDDVDDNVWWDANIRYQRYQRWSCGLRLRNILDEDLREPTPGGAVANLPNDLPLAGRAVYADFSLHY